MCKLLKSLVLSFFVTTFVATFAQAEGFENGSFETGDYTGWTITEEPEGCPTFGTWGIASMGDIIDYNDWLKDYADAIDVQQQSWCLIVQPLVCQPPDFDKMAVYLRNDAQTATLYQDVVVPGDATAISWDMLYHQLYSEEYDYVSEFGINQYLAVSIIELDPDTGAPVKSHLLFMTQKTTDPDTNSPLSAPMKTYTLVKTTPDPDTQIPTFIKDLQGQKIRVLVELKTEAYFMLAAFDNFRFESEAVPTTTPTVLLPSWAKGEKLGWKGDEMPPGLVKMLKEKFADRLDELPPGILKKIKEIDAKGKASAPGQQKKNK